MVSNQWLRRYSLIVQSGSSQLDLSALRFHFKINSSDLSTPNNGEITVTNLAPDTANRIQNEFTKVTLQAGYQDGAFGTIFSGDICQIHRGKESPTDTFLRIVAADGDQAHNFGVISTTLAAGAKPTDIVGAIAAALSPFGIKRGQIQGLADTALPRAKVMYGMARDFLDDLCKTHDTTWSIQNGALTILPNGGSVANAPPIVMNANSGMVGIPIQTEGGVKVKCLMNPNIVVGSTLQLNNNDIVQTLNKNAIVNAGGFTIANLGTATTAAKLTQPLPNLSSDGFYRVIGIEATGDTRGNEWFYDLITLGTDASAPALKNQFGVLAFRPEPTQ